MAIIDNGTDNAFDFSTEVNGNMESRLNIQVAGEGNRIHFKGAVRGEGVINITIFASGCSVVLGEDVIINRGLDIAILPAGGGTPSRNCHVSIGKRCFFNGVTGMVLAETDNRIDIGDDCLLGTCISLTTTDSHPVYDRDTNERINPSSSVSIGNMVWIGNYANFLKKAGIADGSVVAAHAVVTKKFDTPHSIVAGNPATMVKENIRWQKKAD